MVTTVQIQTIKGEAVILFDEELLKSLDWMEGDSVWVEPLEGGGVKLIPVRNSPLRQSAE